MEGLFAILGVLLGYYMAKHRKINQEINQKIGQVKESRKPQWGEPFVVKTDEYKLEQQKLREKEQKKSEEELKVATGKWQK